MEAANRILIKGGSLSDANTAANFAVKSASSINKSSEILQKLQPTLEKPQVKPMFPKKRLTADPSRSLISASFNSNNQLTLEFSDGEKLQTDPIEVLFVDQHVAIKNVYGEGSTAPSDIVVRVVNADTTITDADDIVVATAGCTITLPNSSLKNFRVKRTYDCVGDVIVTPGADRDIDGFSTRVLNLPRYSEDYKQLSNSNWIVL